MYQFRTQGGYPLDEVLSSLQKMVRQSREPECLYWAMELAEQYPRLLWQRLTVVALEDIGLANPLAIILIETLKNQFFEFAKAGKHGSGRLALANAILLLCRSAKTRISDHFQVAIREKRNQENWRLEVEDACIDKHTRSGKAKGRSWSHWLDVGCRLENKADIFDPYEETARRLWPTSKKVTPAKKAKKAGKDLSLFNEEEL